MLNYLYYFGLFGMINDVGSTVKEEVMMDLLRLFLYGYVTNRGIPEIV